MVAPGKKQILIMLYFKSLIFFVGMACHTAGLPAQSVQERRVVYHKADSVATCYADFPITSLPLLAHHLTASLVSPEEKFRAIYYWVCHNIKNDYPAYLQNKRQRHRYRNNPAALSQWNQKFSQQVFLRLRQQRKTVCTGYAYLVQELSRHAGLRSVIIAGYGRTGLAPQAREPNHSWNAVELHGRWYLCDATWGSGAVDPRTGIFIPMFNDHYFLCDPQQFVMNHYPLDTAWLLVNPKPTLQDFYKDISKPTGAHR
jgi:hypothetical protein